MMCFVDYFPIVVVVVCIVDSYFSIFVDCIGCTVIVVFDCISSVYIVEGTVGRNWCLGKGFLEEKNDMLKSDATFCCRIVVDVGC